MSNNYEFKWTDCSGNYGPWKTKNGYFVYRLKDDLLFGEVGVHRFKENLIEALIKNEEDKIIIKKEFAYNDDEILKVEKAKEWCKKEMINILNENINSMRK